MFVPQIRFCLFTIGVANGAAGEAATAPIIRLFIVISKCWKIRRPKDYFIALSLNRRLQIFLNRGVNLHCWVP